jgi:pimeloyl-ACP methyl ester carboxylesterase
VITSTLTLPDGASLQYYDVTPAAADAVPVIYHHGTSNVGEPPAPLYDAATERGLRWIGFDRPGYGGSTRNQGRDIASAATDAIAVADELGIDRFAVLGHSGGGPNALACAALEPARVIAAVSVSGLAPFKALGLNWFSGMGKPGLAELTAAIKGGDAIRELIEKGDFEPDRFTAADHEALAGEWSWFGDIVIRGTARGLGGIIDDDISYVRDWGFDPATITCPTLIVQGADDRIVPHTHGEWLARTIPGAELWLRPGDGHLSVLHAGVAMLDWLRAHSAS